MFAARNPVLSTSAANRTHSPIGYKTLPVLSPPRTRAMTPNPATPLDKPFPHRHHAAKTTVPTEAECATLAIPLAFRSTLLPRLVFSMAASESKTRLLTCTFWVARFVATCVCSSDIFRSDDSAAVLMVFVSMGYGRVTMAAHTELAAAHLQMRQHAFVLLPKDPQLIRPSLSTASLSSSSSSPSAPAAVAAAIAGLPSENPGTAPPTGALCSKLLPRSICRYCRTS